MCTSLTYKHHETSGCPNCSAAEPLWAALSLREVWETGSQGDAEAALAQASQKTYFVAGSWKTEEKLGSIIPSMASAGDKASGGTPWCWLCFTYGELVPA